MVVFVWTIELYETILSACFGFVLDSSKDRTPPHCTLLIKFCYLDSELDDQTPDLVP